VFGLEIATNYISDAFYLYWLFVHMCLKQSVFQTHAFSNTKKSMKSNSFSLNVALMHF